VAGTLVGGGSGVAVGTVAGAAVGSCSGIGVGATLADGPAQAANSRIEMIAKLLKRQNCNDIAHLKKHT